MEVVSHFNQKLKEKNKFLKSRSTAKVKATRKKIRFQQKGLVTRNTHVKYESCINCHSNVIPNIKVFKK